MLRLLTIVSYQQGPNSTIWELVVICTTCCNHVFVLVAIIIAYIFMYFLVYLLMYFILFCFILTLTLIRHID